MKFSSFSNKAFWIFCTLLVGLILASFLGNMVESFVVASDSSGNTTNYATHSQMGTSTFSSSVDASGNTNYDNYNHYNGTSSNALINGTIYYGPNGGTATVITNSDGTQSIKVILPNDPTPVVYTYVTVNQWKGPNGTATLVQSTNGSSALKISINGGQTYIFTVNGNTGTTSATASNYETTYYGSTGTPPPTQSSYYGYGSGSGSGSENAYKQQYYNDPSTTTTTTSSGGSTGIPQNMIPPGQEDLYVLKTSIVPPVCPACPTVVNTCENGGKPPPPCPACARCPEPQFDCKKVPNYSAVNNTSLPIPVLADFSQFGM